MVEKEPLFGGTTAYSAGVIWIPRNSHAAKAGIADTREAALTYLRSHVGNRLDQPKAEAFVDHAHEMLDRFEREQFIEYELSPTWADYHPEEPGGSKGGRSLGPTEFDGTKLGPLFKKLRPPVVTMTALGGMMVGRSDLPHVFKMTEAMASAMHVAGMVARHARARLSHDRGTRLVNGNALIARLAWHARARGIPLWLDAPVVELEIARWSRDRRHSQARRAAYAHRGATRRGVGVWWFPRQRGADAASLPPSLSRQEPRAFAAGGELG